jgi:hypothetical protein
MEPLHVPEEDDVLDDAVDVLPVAVVLDVEFDDDVVVFADCCALDEDVAGSDAVEPMALLLVLPPSAGVLAADDDEVTETVDDALSPELRTASDVPQPTGSKAQPIQSAVL